MSPSLSCSTRLSASLPYPRTIRCINTLERTLGILGKPYKPLARSSLTRWGTAKHSRDARARPVLIYRQPSDERAKLISLYPIATLHLSSFRGSFFTIHSASFAGNADATTKLLSTFPEGGWLAGSSVSVRRTFREKSAAAVDSPVRSW